MYVVFFTVLFWYLGKEYSEFCQSLSQHLVREPEMGRKIAEVKPDLTGGVTGIINIVEHTKARSMCSPGGAANGGARRSEVEAARRLGRDEAASACVPARRGRHHQQRRWRFRLIFFCVLGLVVGIEKRT